MINRHFINNKTTNTILKIKIEFLGLFMPKNRSPFGIQETIECVLNKIMQIERHNKILTKVCKDLKQKLNNPE